MVKAVSDIGSSREDNIRHAAQTLGRSEQKRRLFDAIYTGKKKVKTVRDLAKSCGLSEKRILTLGQALERNRIIDKVKVEGRIAYRKIDFYHEHKKKILAASRNKENLSRIPSKTNTGQGVIVIKSSYKFGRAKQLTIDEIKSFERVKKYKKCCKNLRIKEDIFKQGIKKIIGERGIFKDWSGEKNDLFTTRVRIRRKRVSAAFAFKGKGLCGKLKPSNFGKNGDQIQRLFDVDVDLYVVQYCGQIDQSVCREVDTYATVKAFQLRRDVYYCIIDGDDTDRIIEAYNECFNLT